MTKRSESELENGVPEKIKELATAFRIAIERSDRAKLPITFADFPLGSCGDAANLLGAYLTDCGIESLKYVCGQRGEKSHVWLESGGLIIDITGDQFDDCDEPVIVRTDASWHDTFDRQKDNLADFRLYDPGAVSRLAGSYKEILGRI